MNLDRPLAHQYTVTESRRKSGAKQVKTLNLSTADSSILTYLASAIAAEHDLQDEQLLKLYSGLSSDGKEIASALLKIKHKRTRYAKRQPSEPAMKTAHSLLAFG